MPIMDGFKATSIIRQIYNDRGYYCTIIALSAMKHEGDVDKSIEAGMD